MNHPFLKEWVERCWSWGGGGGRRPLFLYVSEFFRLGVMGRVEEWDEQKRERGGREKVELKNDLKYCCLYYCGPTGTENVFWNRTECVG
jgi:hypothetical protein